MLFQIRQGISRLSIMRVNRIEFIGIKEIIIAAAAYRPDPFQLIVIFKNSHKTGNVSLYRSFIHNSGMIDPTLRRTGTVVAHHNGNRPPASDALGNILTGKIALYLCFCLTACIRLKAYQILLCSECRDALSDTDACCHNTCQNTCLFRSHILPPFLPAERSSA